MILQIQVREIIKPKKLAPRELLQNITDILCLPTHSLLVTFFFYGRCSPISLSNSFSRLQSLIEIEIHSWEFRADSAAPVGLNSVLSFLKNFLHTSKAKKD